MGKSKKKSLIVQFTKGLRPNDAELEEDYLDWYFLSHFGKGPGFWRELPESKLYSYITLESIREKNDWDTWIKILSKLMG